LRVVVVGASSGLGRCIGTGLAREGETVALLARRLGRLLDASKEAGPGASAVECDVTDPQSVDAAIAKTVAELGGIDGLVYTPAVGPLVGLADTQAATWRHVFDTNVIGASLVTAAALEHLAASRGTAIYLSSVMSSMTPPWPGLGAYAVSKAALDKLVEAWRAEHPEVNFTRLVVGDCAGGEGDSSTGFANDWDPELFAKYYKLWESRDYLARAFIDATDLVSTVHALLKSGSSISMPWASITPRPH
jgi:NAD(P)-dependent dehydrogenase (short-subunit alcohol dehydrogenase family)